MNIPSRIRTEVGKYALCYGTQVPRKCFSSKYPQHEFKCSTVNNWKENITKDPKSRVGQFTKVGRPNKVNDEVMLKIREMIIAICLAGAIISRNLVISIGTGVLKANNANSLSELKEMLY